MSGSLITDIGLNSTPVSPTAPDRNLSLEAQILAVLDQLRPGLQADGGDMEFMGFDAVTGIVTLRLVGACAACPMSQLTLKWGIEETLKRLVPSVTEVEAI